jgi:glycosyltransferase involved in cell wall biosynthesis
MPDNRPLTARVVLLTYNHEKWIAQAIESVLTQKADFRFDIEVIEDCSTDRTREIVVGYGKRHPERIKLTLAERNRNSNVDWVRALREAPAPYVVTLDGDDYWTSPRKLGKQVAFMQAHPDCSLSYHNARCVFDDGRKPWNHNPPDEKRVSTFDDMLASNFVTTVGAMVAKARIDPIPDWLETVKWGDWGLYLYAASKGTVRYIDEVLAVYRIHRGGAWWGLSETRKLEGILEFYEQMNANLGYEHDAAIREHMARNRSMLEQLREPQRSAPRGE